MHPSLEQLLVIQDRDRHIMQLRAEQQRIPAELVALQAKLDSETQALETLKTQVKQTESDRKKLELEAESKRQQITKYKIQQNQVRKNEEFQALSHEIERAEAEVRQIEDRELEVMDALDHLQQDLRQRQSALVDTTKLIKQQIADLERRAEAITTQIASLEGERAKLAEQIDPDLLARYQRILDRRRDAAIVSIQHDNCGGCHLKLTPQTIHLAKGGKELAACDFCGRLLYWMP